MVTMIDQIYDRDYRAHRTELNQAFGDSVSRLVSAAANAFAVLNRIEYSAPWNPTRRNIRAN